MSSELFVYSTRHGSGSCVITSSAISRPCAATRHDSTAGHRATLHEHGTCATRHGHHGVLSSSAGNAVPHLTCHSTTRPSSTTARYSTGTTTTTATASSATTTGTRPASDASWSSTSCCWKTSHHCWCSSTNLSTYRYPSDYTD